MVILAYGKNSLSGCLIFFNARVSPVVFELGSLGASGDLAPLAHLALPMAGLGEVWFEGRRQPADVVLQQHGWAPLNFEAKESLAMLNGYSIFSSLRCLVPARKPAIERTG